MRGGPDLNTIGGRLKAERQRIGLSQTALADAAGVTKSAILKWERNDSSPTASVLASFAQAGADVLFIVTGRYSPDGSDETSLRLVIRSAMELLSTSDRRWLIYNLLLRERTDRPLAEDQRG